MGAHITRPKADRTNSKKILKSHNAGFRLPQDCVDSVVSKLLVTGKSRFESGLDFSSWASGKGDLVFENLKARVIKNNAIVFAKVTIDVVTIKGVVNYLLGEGAVKSASDVSESLAAALKQVPPGAEDIALLRQLRVKNGLEYL